jgi:hypothetical protein
LIEEDQNMMIDLQSKQAKHIVGEIATKEEIARLRREEVERNIAKRQAQIKGVQTIYGEKPSI